MDGILGLWQEVAGAAVVALLTLAGRRGVEAWRSRRGLGALRALVGNAPGVSVVLPSFEVPGDYRGTARANIFFMSNPEGAAIARLSSALHGAAPRARSEYRVHRDFKAGSTPFITLGGPSVNSVTERVLARYCPEFAIEYPAHLARVGSMSFAPEVDADGALVEDYGFVLAGLTNGGSRFVALWGVLAFGSLAATEAFLTSPSSSDWFGDHRYLAVVHCRVEDAEISDVEIVHERRYPAA